MTTDEAVLLVSKALEDLGSPYIVVGGFSSNTHGIPRSTKDLDVVVSITSLAFPDLLPRLGNGWSCDPQFSFETNTGTMRQILEHVDSAFKVELFALSEDLHDQSRFQRRIRKDIGGLSVSLPTAEDVIVWKLRWARPKDLDDVRNVIYVREREGSLDWEYIRGWCAKHGTLERLEGVLASLPKRKG